MMPITPVSDIAGILLSSPVDLYRHTPVHNHEEAGFPGAAGGIIINDPELEPYGPGPGGYGIVDHTGHVFGAAEDIDHLVRLGQVQEAAIRALAKDLDLVRVDGCHLVTFALQVAGHPEAGPAGVGGQPHHGNLAHAEYSI